MKNPLTCGVLHDIIVTRYKEVRQWHQKAAPNTFESAEKS